MRLSGNKKLDVFTAQCIFQPGGLFTCPHSKQGCQEIVLELKLRYGDREKTIKKGLEQTWEYLDKCGTTEGYLLIFDRNKKRTWKEKIFKDKRAFKGITIGIYGM